MRVKRVALEDHRHVPVARGEVGDVTITDRDAAVADLLEPGDHAQQRRLTAPGRADQDDELAVRDAERDVVDRDHSTLEDLRHVLEQDPGHGAQHTRPDRRKTRPKCIERVKWY